MWSIVRNFIYRNWSTTTTTVCGRSCLFFLRLHYYYCFGFTVGWAIWTHKVLIYYNWTVRHICIANDDATRVQSDRMNWTDFHILCRSGISSAPRCKYLIMSIFDVNWPCGAVAYIRRRRRRRRSNWIISYSQKNDLYVWSIHKVEMAHTMRHRIAVATAAWCACVRIACVYNCQF